MPTIARELLAGLPWSTWGQAAMLLLLTQARLLGIASPLAAAWFGVHAARGSAWPMLPVLAAGAFMAGGSGWWAMPVLAAGFAAAMPWIGGISGTPLAMAGALGLTEAIAGTQANPACTAQWLLCALAAIAAAIPLAALKGLSADEAKDARRRWTGLRAFVGLAENVPGAAALRSCRFPPQGQARKRECPAKSPKRAVDAPGRERESACGQRLRSVGWAILGVGAATGAAAAVGGEAGMLVAATCMVQWPGERRELPAVLLAAALALAGVPLAIGSALLTMSIALQLLERQGWPMQALVGVLAAGMWLLAGGEARALGYLIALMPATALLALLPRRRTKEEYAQDAQWIQEKVARQTRQRLDALASVMSEMAQGGGSGPDPPQEDALLLSLRTRLCEGCVRYERCWNGRAGEGLRLLCELITRSVNGTLPERVLPDMMRRCMRANIIPDRLYAELNRFAQVRSMRIACMDGAQRAKLTIDTAADMLRTLAGAQPLDDALGHRLERALHCGGVRRTAVLDSDGGLTLLRSGGWNAELCARALRICERTLGERLESEQRDGRAFCLRRIPAVEAKAGWDSISAEGSRSGDSLYIGALDDRRQLVVISDGMGVGAAAAGESQRAVAAVRRFLQSGIDPERSALLANRLLADQGCGDMFATLDLCVIDNGRMEAIWVKMAACDSYLLRGGACRVIPGGRLPMGIVAEAAPQVCVVRLQPGDVIVMGTDGAMEGLDAETALRCIAARRDTDAMRLAKRLRQAGEARRIHVDDQTLAVVCIRRTEERRTGGDPGRDDGICG